MTTPVAPDTGSFAADIRSATTDIHRDAERAPFLRALVGGRLPLSGYGRLVVQHLAVYDALESGNDQVAGDAVAGAFVDRSISRSDALALDVVAVLGPEWDARPEATLAEATAEYCARLREVASSWPAGWVGHQYVRYLGDLSGGVHLRRAIEGVYGIDATTGTAFYDFPSVPDPDAWKRAYRARLDGAAWDVEERAAIVTEIVAAYRWNTALLEQLG